MKDDWQDRILMVIPSIDGARFLQRMLPSLRFKPANVVVLDQGSSDDTASVCCDAGVQLLQLGHPHTYTQACNIGARIARQRGYPFLCVSNNDVVFRTDVLSELLAEMERDAKLGIVAPSQVILDLASNVDVLACRVFWNLNEVEFLHDLTESPALPRLEADFCELTCALIRMSAVKEVGFLDDAYGFYHEDADFCFRLRKSGYSAAYLPQSQIYHFASSTFSRKRQAQIDYMRRNRIYFAAKHLGYGVCLPQGNGMWAGEASIVARRLNPVLKRYGMVDDSRPELITGRVGASTSGYLLTTQRSSPPPKRLQKLRGCYEAVIATSNEVVHILHAAGFASFRAPLGIDPDVFHPWGPVAYPAARRFDEAIYLAFAAPYDHRPLTCLLRAWSRFIVSGRRARLVVVGNDLVRRIGRVADTAYRTGATEISYYTAERLELHEPRAPLSDQRLAAYYRSVDFTIIAQAEGSSLTLLESLACGTPAVFDAGCVRLAALYRDVTGNTSSLNRRGGHGRPPDDLVATADGLLNAIERSASLSAEEREASAATARYQVLGHSTLRHTAMAFCHVLEAMQEREPARLIQQLQMEQPAPSPNVNVGLPVVQRSLTTVLRSRLSGAIASRLTKTAINLKLFGTKWEQQGLPAATSSAAARVRIAATRRRAPLPVLPSLPVPADATGTKLKKPRSPSPLLIGYIDAQLGIGQSLRGLATAIAEVGLPFSIYPFGVGVEGRRSIPTMPERYDEITSHNINIIEVSPAELPRVFNHVTADHFDGSYNILRTYWELAKGPEAWRQNHCMDRINEIWAPNEFCAEAFRDFFNGPIVIIPPCLNIVEPSSALLQDKRSRFGLDPDTFYFMYSFDYYSFPERKNPLAAIRAFLTAFPDLDRPVGLMVKATSAEGHFPGIKNEIMAAAQADGRIMIIDASLTREDMMSLMASIDCYVSLHRSEGFGLGMAEALALGKPVIATDYSGSSDFLTESTGYPVSFKLIPVRAHEYVHTEGQVWADPDEDACAEAMRKVIDYPEEAASRAAAGRAFVNNRYSATNVGRLAAERLAVINRTNSLG